jgi:hypothetical protein
MEGKCKVVPALNEATTLRSHVGGAQVYFQAFSTSALDEAERPASRPGLFTPGVDCTEGYEGPCASVDAATKRKIPAPAGN